MSIERISTMVAHDASSVSGVSRGRYLDDLLRKKFNLADHDNDMPKCGGDLHRASLPVGDPYVHHSGQHGPSRDLALDSLRDAINAIWDQLPDLVIMRDIRDCLPPDVLDDLGSRERVNIRIAFAFSDRGVVVRRIGQADKRSARRLYILRNHDQYVGLKPSKLADLYEESKRPTAGLRTHTGTAATAARAITPGDGAPTHGPSMADCGPIKKSA